MVAFSRSHWPNTPGASVQVVPRARKTWRVLPPRVVLPRVPKARPHDLVHRSSEVQALSSRLQASPWKSTTHLPESFQRDSHPAGSGAVDVRADWRTRRALDEHDLLDVPIVARVAHHSRGSCRHGG